jgi:hypothetical protein
MNRKQKISFPIIVVIRVRQHQIERRIRPDFEVKP